MVERKKFSKDEIKRIGLRIRASRVLTGLTQEEFGSKHNIPVPSIKTWEFGSVVPRLDGLTKFADALRGSDIYVSPDWLLHGIGTGPSYFLGQRNDNLDEIDASLLGDSTAFKELFRQICKKSKENPVIVEIHDDEMLPIFKLGDLVAGVLMDKSNYEDDSLRPMLVNLGDGSYVVRYLHLVEGQFFVCSLKNPKIKRVKVESFCCIRWHRFSNLSCIHNE
jgi:transcriptional regulator with XRE-family HTH domain